jgi:putative Holliday junction resolvase
MKYLAVDFGLKHLGVAISEGELAEPLAEKKYSSETEGLSWLSRMAEEQAAEKIIFGLPEGNLAETVKNFAKKLGEVTGKEIIFQDETLSTVEAKQKLLEAGKPLEKRRLDHRASAALILQDYLDSIK